MKQRQNKGTTLAISLMLLMVISLIGINAIRLTQQQEKMSHHSQDKMISFEASEAAIIEAETLIGALDTEPSITDSCPNATANGTTFCINDYTNNLMPEYQDTSWWATNGETHNILYPTSVVNKNRVNTPPMFYIEHIRFVADSPVIGNGVPSGTHYYRVFGRGTGVTNKATSYIETTYRRRY